MKGAFVMNRIRFFFFLVLLLGLLAPQGMALDAPVQEWQVSFDASLGVSPIPFPSEQPNGVVVAAGGFVCRIDGKGNVLWQKPLGPEAGRSGVYEPLAADLDGDGEEEVLAGHKSGILYALSADTGAIRWEFNVGSPLDSWEMATAADLDGDGQAEVITCNIYGWIFCLDKDGKLIWRSKVEDYRPSTPAVGDINGDGELEIVYGTATRHMIALKRTGELLWITQHPPLHLGRTQPLIADLDRDGDAEIYSLSSMISPDTGLLSLNGKDGSLRWVAPTYHKAYMGRGLVRFSDGSLGVLACDKGNNVCAYDASGKERWRTRLENGAGIWTPPATADVDGDGAMEILVGMRRGHWAVLSNEGALLASIPGEGGHFGAGAVADIDNDGILEIIQAVDKGIVAAYTFGGAARSDAILSGDWRGPGYAPLRTVEVGERLAPPAPPMPAKLIGDPHFGQSNNLIELSLPEHDRPMAIEVSTATVNRGRHIEVFRANPGEAGRMVNWPALVRGEHTITIRCLDLESGVVLSQEKLIHKVRNIHQSFEREATLVRAEIQQFQQMAQKRQHTLAANRLSWLDTNLLNRSQSIYQELRFSSDKPLHAQLEAAEKVTAFQQECQRYLLTARHIQAALDADDDPGRLVTWQDADPWDNTDPRIAIPQNPEPLVIEGWAFGNETESFCVNLFNASSEALTVRVQPGSLKQNGEGVKGISAKDTATLHRVMWLPSKFRSSAYPSRLHQAYQLPELALEKVPDLLPKLGSGRCIDVAPLDVKQLWINVNTRDLPPGDYEWTWPLTTLDARAEESLITLRLTVSPVRLPDEPAFYAGFWSRNQVGDFSTIDDLNQHLQTIWYGIPLPAATADASGNLTGDVDWSAHDAVVSKAKRVKRILYGGGVPTPKFPEGVAVTDELKLQGRRAYFNALVEHMKTFDLDHTNIMFYVEDETGLHGTHEHYMERAKANKAVDPRVQNYANPWGAITVEMIRDMEPYTDFWQPGMETVEFLGEEYVQAMRGPDNKPISMYTPPGNCRILRPLGFFRAQAWQAFHWGIEGGGWWVYHSTNLWATSPTQEPDYGGVIYDGHELTTSRRWEAMRDGIEDFDALQELQRLTQEQGDTEAAAILQDASDFMADRTITGMPREAAPYDVDYGGFMQHRGNIRRALERLKP
jgi:outer membrane protein assembly factor BamB